MSDHKKSGNVADTHTQSVKPNDHESGRMDELKRQVEEYKGKYLRALADYQNLEKRISEERETWIQGAHKKLMEKLLPFLDNLDRAEAFIKDENLKMIASSFRKILEQEGLSEIDVLGKEYDPYVAEVLDIVPGDRNNVVTEVLRKGYRFNGTVLRVAQVKVSKKVH